MTIWIAVAALTLILLVGLSAILWDWIDDHRLEISMVCLVLAVIVTMI